MKWGHVFAEDAADDLGCIDGVENFPIVAHVHDEAQMEVDAEEIEVYQYNIPSDSWKEEEKREHWDDQGRMWSAPTKLEAFDDQVACVRMYHPLGQIYAQSITQAGEFLGLRCPTAGEYKIGDSWVDTH